MVLVVALLGAGCGGGDQPKPPVVTTDATTSPLVSIQDDTVYKPGADTAGRIRTMAELGAAVIRVDMHWSQVAPTKPANPEDPADPAYNWKEYDAVVDTAKASGVEVMFAVYATPPWAADPSVTAPPLSSGLFVPPTAIRPRDAADYGAFATAAAARYVPRGVRRWEGWNEPNIPLFLYPQYETQGNRYVAVSPGTYSDLLKAFYAGIKRGGEQARVAGAVTAPAGDPC